MYCLYCESFILKFHEILFKYYILPIYNRVQAYRLNEPNGVPWTMFIWTQAKLSCLDVQSNVVCYVRLDASQIELVGRPEQRSMLRSFGRKPN